MTLVMIQQLIGDGYLPLDMMHPFYPRDCKEGTKLFFIINRVFNDKLEEVNISFDNPFEGKIHDSYLSGGYRYDKKVLNLTEVVEKYHIPRNYYLELFVQSLYPIFRRSPSQNNNF